MVNRRIRDRGIKGGRSMDTVMPMGNGYDGAKDSNEHFQRILGCLCDKSISHKNRNEQHKLISLKAARS